MSVLLDRALLYFSGGIRRRRRRQLRCEIIHFGITGQKPLLKWMMVEEIDISGR